MDTAMRVEKELEDLISAGQITWLNEDEAEKYLYDDMNLFFEILHCHDDYSQIVSFLLNGKCFHYLLHFEDAALQKQRGVQFFWPISSSLAAQSLSNSC